MIKFDVEVRCCLCSASHKTEATLPEGWEFSEMEIIDERSALCPQHAAVQEWISAQCPGCAESWGGCSLWSLAFMDRRGLTANELDTISAGRCPKRVNGTITFSPVGGLGATDISETAPRGSGDVLVQAIKEYWERYVA